MAKEVIYIDTKDDITSIIDKIRQSAHKIIALVPPKQIGVLQSAVNLQLLVREAKHSQKVLVIITGQESLIRLAAVAGVPVAKTLTSKPEMPEIPALKVDGEDDIIDGTKIGIGEMAGLPAETKPNPKTTASTKDESAPKLAPVKIKVPNYDKFRKKLIIGGAGFVVLVAFFVWALAFAPRAEVTITTTAKAVNISSGATLVEKTDQQSYEKNILAVQVQKLTKKRTHEFQATGEKDLKTKASGRATILKMNGGPNQTVKAGTVLTTGNGLKFITTRDVVVPRAELSGSNEIIPGRAEVTVEAADFGDTYNIGPQSMSIGGSLKAEGGQMSGGSNRRIKVMTKEDYDKAKEELIKGGNDAALKELRNKFDGSTTVIGESLIAQEGEIKTSSKVDEEAIDGKVKMEQESNYQITGITNKILTEYLNKLALKDNAEAKVYDAGLADVVFKDFVVAEGKVTVRIASQAKIGPNIDNNEVKEYAKGKQQSEIRAHFLAIEGVKDVRVNFSPFWVKKAPGNANKITVVVEN